MSLEANQGAHNGFIAGIANTIASNDTHEIIKLGAEKIAAGQTLGLSEAETLSAVSRQTRRQNQRAAYRDRNRRAAEWSQSQKTLLSEGFNPNLPDTDVVYNDQLTEEQEAFGETDYEAGLRNLDEDYGRDTKEPEYERRGTRTYKRSGRQYPIGNPVRPEETDDFKPEIAPKSVMTSALSRLEGSTKTGAVDARDRLTRQVEGGADLELQRFLAGELAEADRASFDPELRQYNDYRAEAESQAIAREFFGGYGSGSMADDAIGRIAEIRKLGGSGA